MITINELRKIQTTKMKIKDILVDYLSKEEGATVEGTPSFFELRNIGLNVLSLDI